jgi:hypothetical protein
MRALRTLAPVRPINHRQAAENLRLHRAAFWFALIGVIIEFAISGNTLADLGIDYASNGGNPLVKLHPGTYMVAIGAFIALFLERPAGSALIRLFREAPALAMFNVLILFCAFYSIVNVGFSGAAVYVESYLAAGMLLIAMRHASDRQKRALGWVIIFFCVLSVFLSIYEGATQTHLIPMNFGDDDAGKMAEIADAEDFRGAGLFAHPLTAAVVTAMAVFMLLRMEMNGLWKATLFTILLVGLLSFGGRAALGTTVVLVGVAAVAATLRGLVRRDLTPGFMAAIGAGLFILPPLILVLITSTDIGGRIISHMYYDDSAAVRNIQWLVLQHLNLHDVLFGVPPDRMEVLKYQIGLGGDTTDIENFWLLMFLNLGIMGFIVFLIALGLLVGHLGRKVAHPLGWLLLLAAILIDSTSNSLGRKSIDLFMMAACMTVMTGYPKRLTQQAAVHRRPAGGLRRPLTHDIHLAGIKP